MALEVYDTYMLARKSGRQTRLNIKVLTNSNIKVFISVPYYFFRKSYRYMFPF